ncbi:MAG: FG-GAP repeat protein, partial [Acidobacteria bacterium]|nr:FG-GAP repeat protein [Acidobacteriota bacterium]
MSVVEQVLERRQARDRAALGRFSTVTSILLHALLVAALILGPRLGRQERPPIKYVSAQIVPLQALGRPEPPPKAPPQKPRAEPPPPPQPQPEVASPKEETPTPKDPEIPVLPDRKAPAAPPAAPAPEPLPPAPPVRQGSETGNNRGTAAFGAAVAALGDVNNDGRDDVLVGAPDFDGAAGADTGKAYVFDGLTGALLYSFEGAGAGDAFG